MIKMGERKGLKLLKSMIFVDFFEYFSDTVLDLYSLTSIAIDSSFSFISKSMSW